MCSIDYLNGELMAELPDGHRSKEAALEPRSLKAALGGTLGSFCLSPGAKAGRLLRALISASSLRAEDFIMKPCGGGEACILVHLSPVTSASLCVSATFPSRCIHVGSYCIPIPGAALFSPAERLQPPHSICCFTHEAMGKTQASHPVSTMQKLLQPMLALLSGAPPYVQPPLAWVC